jgi:hypothetical protein
MSQKHSTSVTSDPEEQEYVVYPILEGTDWREHGPGHEFCEDMDCPCHEDQDAIGKLNGYYQDGLVSAEDADNIYRGKTLR